MKALYLVLGSLIISGCAAMVADYQANTCNYNGGYEKGVNDAQAGSPLATQKVIQLCDEKVKAETSQGYREGYMTIKKNPVININTQSEMPRTCKAKSGMEAHQSFCAAQNSTTCEVHSLCVFR